MKRLLLSLLCIPATLAAQAPREAPADAPASVVVVPDGEPGTPLVIRGVVYSADGRTPVAGASVYVYQTDARGYYAPDDARASGSPRLRGYLRTDEAGRYDFVTVRPGSYPGTRNPGHIHYHVRAPGHAERVFEIVFEGDPLIPERWRRDAGRPGANVAIVRLEDGGEGVLRGEQDVVLVRLR